MPSPTLTDKVAKMIRHDILVGNFAPSEKLVVADLKTRYDVGASPIREALVQLSWSKFVVVEPQKGCWVAPISTSELADLHDSLRIITPVLLKQAINHGDESWELELLTAYHKLSRLKTMQEEYDWIEWQERQRHFHECLLNAATSKIMLSFFADLLNQVQRYRFHAINSGLHIHAIDVDEYESIVKCVLAKDSDNAVIKYERYISNMILQLDQAVSPAA
ncbi:GntR family transcriptional regulator [Vibrio rhodolitus]|uniref:GntR family transcriptional regulator n=1 Tax=Vibrio rhodolitus TaxID=2231649 RepID=UPI000E0B9F4A|nr:GntR family transcriptional regulator [Vibrio rhodolitus]